MQFWLISLQALWCVCMPAAAGMIHVWRLAGQELAAVGAGKFPEVTTVRLLKCHFCSFYDLPMCLSGQLVKGGCTLNDAFVLSAPCDVQLMSMPMPISIGIAEVSEKLTAASFAGRVETVRLLLQAGQAGANIIMQWAYRSMHPDAFICACHNGHVDVARLLLEERVDVNLSAKMVSQHSCLHPKAATLRSCASGLQMRTWAVSTQL